MADNEHDTALDERPTGSDKLREVHARAMRRFDDSAWPTQELRYESMTARRFCTIPGAQWEGEWGEQFENSIKVEINKAGRMVRKIETDYRQNRIVPDFRPEGGMGDDDTADMLDGIHRADSNRFKSQQARDNAVFEAIAGGFGAWRLTNEWEDEYDPDNEHQRINPASLITDADQCVFFDINAKLYDKSDAGHVHVRVVLSREVFEERYGADKATDFPEGVPWHVRDWFTPDTVCVSEYYEVETTREALLILTYPASGEERRIWETDLEDGELAQMQVDGWTVRKQRRKRCRVHKYVMSGAEVLEDRGYIAGRRIPVVPVYGQRYFVDGIERWKGCVQDKMDAQRLYNAKVSKLAETDSLAPREVPIFAPEQMPPQISALWAEANIKRHPYLLAEPLRNEDGTIAIAGPISKVEPPTLGPVTATLLQVANQDLLEDTEDGADEVKANISAEAMDIAATRIDAKSGIYLDNIRQSVQCEGEIYVGMASEVYYEKGRKVETMDEDGGDGTAVLHQGVTDNVTGEFSVINDLQTGRYKVVVSVTEATSTRRDKAVRSSINLAGVAQQAGDAELAQVSLLTAVMNQDGEGMKDLQSYARKRLVSMGVVPPNDTERAAMEQASQDEQPDPMQQVAIAEAQRLQTEAAKNIADVAETEANTGLKKAQTLETMAKAGKARREARMAELPGYGRMN